MFWCCLFVIYFIQLVTNDRFKSAMHRVVSSHIGPRISIASFFCTGMVPTSKLYGPIKELLSENNPPIYQEVTASDCCGLLQVKGLGGKTSALDYFKLDKTEKWSGEFHYYESVFYTIMFYQLIVIGFEIPYFNVTNWIFY